MKAIVHKTFLITKIFSVILYKRIKSLMHLIRKEKDYYFDFVLLGKFRNEKSLLLKKEANNT